MWAKYYACTQKELISVIRGYDQNMQFVNRQRMGKGNKAQREEVNGQECREQILITQALSKNASLYSMQECALGLCVCIYTDPAMIKTMANH